MGNNPTREQKERLEHHMYEVNTMLCGCCGDIIARKEPGRLFDIWDCGWPCDSCGKYLLSSDGWHREYLEGR